MVELNFRPIIPMGAIKPNDGELLAAIVEPDYIAEVKYDGFRMLAWIDQDKVRFTTRSVAVETARAGDPWPTERTDNLPHLRDLYTGDLYGTILDGEIWKKGCTSHDITSMVGGLPQTSIANQEKEGYVTYRIYDILQYKGQDVTGWPFWKRRNLLEDIYEQLIGYNEDVIIDSPTLGMTNEALLNNYIKLSRQIAHEEKEEGYTSLLANGGEGIILKHKDSKYYIGKIHKGKGVPAKVKASKSKGIPFTPWIKWKKKDTFDCVVMGFSPAKVDYTGSELSTWGYWEDENGNNVILPGLNAAEEYMQKHGNPVKPVTKFHFYRWPGAIIFGQYNDDGELVEVGQTSGIADNWRSEFATFPENYIGKAVVVEAMEKIKKTGALREPRFLYFREPWDKAPEECLIEE